ncbi:hypothetical protein D9611_007409 [Ephemerocybe angulata]|uniref:GST N-terminal domain-containing protein n=1 Tax=Ephemerocybe angulata TaxID=980116 RepID=A0A8H5CF42_9AGAR|nr:hypothetical protein D9611_007409 [Tulosesus angulatus]
MITLFDFPTALPGKTLSVYVWKIRLALNIKGLQHQTQWVSFSEIEKELKKAGLPPSKDIPTNNFGTRYTVPALHDPSTNTKISDSKAILKYLDDAYPETLQLTAQPKVDPQLDDLVAEAFGPSWPLAFAMILHIYTTQVSKVVLGGLQGEDSAKYRMRMEGMLKTTVEDWMQNTEGLEESLKKGREAFRAADDWLEKSRKIHGGKWALGDNITLADIEIGTVLAFLASVLGEEDKLWNEIIQEWDEGRWGVYWNQIKQYTQVL